MKLIVVYSTGGKIVEKRKIINLGISFLIISMCISMFYSFLPIEPLDQMGKVIGLLVGLAILIYLGYLSGVKFLLLLLFLTFGWMNLPLKPFDLLFVLIFPLYFMMKQKNLIIYKIFGLLIILLLHLSWFHYFLY